MAKCHRIFCCTFLPSVLLIEGVGGMGSKVRWGGVKWGGVGGDKNPCLGHPMSSHDVNTVANDTPVGHIVSESKPRSPLPN